MLGLLGSVGLDSGDIFIFSIIGEKSVLLLHLGDKLLDAVYLGLEMSAYT